MNIVAIGDLQGCAEAARALMAQVRDDIGEPDQWWFCGDLVNRGPDSLGCLQLVRGLGDRAVAVLGNHDLHLLAVGYGAQPASRADTLEAVLAAPDRADWLLWLRHRPLVHAAHGHVMVHAGLQPAWSAADACLYAREVERELQGPHPERFLRAMYGNTPAGWDDALVGDDRLRCIVNTCTRMRFCRPDGTMDFKTKDRGAEGGPPGYLPWFAIPGRKTSGASVVFGHWSTLGLRLEPGVTGIDTGCVWGGALTAVQLGTSGTRSRYWQLPCVAQKTPGTD